MSDYPYSKENHLFDQSKRSGSDLIDIAQNLQGMRQLGIAKIVSVPKDHIKFTISLLSTDDMHKSDAFLLGDPNEWNQKGWPQQDDLVLVMHQRQGGDAHIISKIQNKLKPILSDPTMLNHDGILVGVEMA